MADATGNNGKVGNSVNQSIVDYIETMSLDEMGLLQDISLTLKGIARQDGIKISQSSLRDLATVEQQASVRANRITNRNQSAAGDQTAAGNQSTSGSQGYRRRSSDDYFNFDKQYGKRRAKGMFDKLTDDFEDAFMEALTGSKNPFQDAIDKAAAGFADSLNVSVDKLGEELGKRAGEAVKNSAFGKRMEAEMGWFKDKASKVFGKGMDDLASMFRGDKDFNVADLFGDIRDGAKDVADDFKNIRPQDLENDFNQMGNIFKNFGNMFKPSTQSASAIEDASKDIIDTTFKDLGPVDDVISKGSKALGEGVKQIGAEAVTTSTDLMVVGEGAAEAGTSLVAAAEGSAVVEAGMASAGAAAAGAAVAFPLLTLGIIAATIVVDKLSEAMGPAIEGFQSFSSGITNAANREVTQRSKNTELEKKRREEDIKSIRKAAFDVIEQSAEKVEQVWDNILTTVTATQGYDKAGVQDLWSTYAQRLKDEGLEKVVSSADIMDKLSSVLQQGLSGAAAEEFAYQATLLSNAIPTEDFFQYASTYASIVANAMKDGADQEQAIALANEELVTFADNLLHASRQLAGGLTTSLTNASSLFEKSAQIAFTSRTGDISEISRLLTSVSGVVGAIAPDLADGIVNAVVQAATGGNSSEITALRSLAGTGASNTAFLNALASDPKQVFTTLFYNLSQLQNMSSENYMEVAEALSGVFGIERDAFARVDFEYLASAIDQMNDTDGDLQQNLDLLAAGQTTLTESQVRMQKINEYMIDEGLAYVLDNEVARQIQQHMWDEQLAREIEETQFSVDLVGGALDLLTGILNTVDLIGSFLNPVGWISKIANVALTAIESVGESQDLKAILEKGKVGEGTQKEFYNLTTAGKNLGLATPYVELLGGVSEQRVVENLVNVNNMINGPDGAIHLLAETVETIVDPVGSLVEDVQQAAGLVDAVALAAQEGIDASSDASEAAADAAAEAAEKVVNSSESAIEASQELTKTIGEQAKEAVVVQPEAPAESYYKRAVVSKSISSIISSGDWRTNRGYNALWGNYGDSGTDYYETVTQDDAKELSELISTSLKNYVKTSTDNSRSIDDLRKTIAEDKTDSLIERDIALLEEQGTLQHRGFFTNADMVDAVAAQLAEIEGNEDQASFDDWLANFEKENGIGNLSALLSDYGESISTIEAIYQQEQAARENAAEKARQLHEVQFWEDMQQFATVDFPWYMREWERYYIQHEAYTEATNNAYAEAVNLAVEEKGELGDSVLALAEALTENNMWQEELGDKIKDPVVHTNVILSKILLCVEAIMQQNNETSIVSVPTALSALGLSISNV